MAPASPVGDLDHNRAVDSPRPPSPSTPANVHTKDSLSDSLQATGRQDATQQTKRQQQGDRSGLLLAQGELIHSPTTTMTPPPSTMETSETPCRHGNRTGPAFELPATLNAGAPSHALSESPPDPAGTASTPQRGRHLVRHHSEGGFLRTLRRRSRDNEDGRQSPHGSGSNSRVSSTAHIAEHMDDNASPEGEAEGGGDEQARHSKAQLHRSHSAEPVARFRRLGEGGPSGSAIDIGDAEQPPRRGRPPLTHTDSRVSSMVLSAMNARKRISQWRERTADAIAGLRAGSTHSTKKERADVWNFFPMLGSALQVPFASMMAHPMPPVVLEAFHVTVQYALQETRSMPSNLMRHDFVVECRYGPYHWTVERDILEFYSLHTKLSALRWFKSLNRKLPPFPSQIAHLLDQVAHPRRSPQGAADAEASRARALEIYLTSMLRSLNMVPEISELCEFLTFSSISFDHRHFPTKPTEMAMRRRTRHALHKLLPCLWRTRKEDMWLVVGESWLTMMANLSDPLPVQVLLMGPGFDIFSYVHGPPGFRKHSVIVTTVEGKEVEIQLESERMHKRLLEELDEKNELCEYTNSNPYGSFAPPRAGCYIEFFVDGNEYFPRVADAMQEARHTIYILDWWLTPELYLKRPICKANEEWRLDRLLFRKATEGVKIFILVYKEMAAALANNSFHTKFYMLSLHPNIHVQRHPDALHSYMWAHHEKAVIIDECTVYMGGLDLCLGRYDTHSHPLTDTGAAKVFPGQDYSNPRVTDFRNVDREWGLDAIERATTPRMPWHDVACHVEGSVDMARHFVQRWNLIKGRKAADPTRRDVPLLQPPPSNAPRPPVEGVHTVQLTRSLSQWSCGVATERSILHAYVHHIQRAKHFIFIENQFFVTASGMAARARNRIGEALFERVRQAHEAGRPFKVIVLMPLLPAFAGAIDAANGSTLRMVMSYQYDSISRGSDSLIGRLTSANIPWEQYVSFFALRSWDTMGPEAAEGSNTVTQSEPSVADLAQPGNSSTDGMRARSSSRTDMVTVGSNHSSRPRRNTTASAASPIVTEMVYIHSKLMIVDDCVAILGSANINDRSMLGERDSELAIVVEGASDLKINMNEAEISVDGTIHDLRMRLMKEHTGCLNHTHNDAALSNVLSEGFDRAWTETAASNTRIFREVFRCVPDDSVETWADYSSFTSIKPLQSMPLDEARAQLSRVQGHLVEFPTRFLGKANLGASLLSAENLIPPEVFA